MPNEIISNMTEQERKTARRRLFDLAKILDNIHNEQWENANERNAVIRGLQTWPRVLRDLANHIELPKEKMD